MPVMTDSATKGRQVAEASGLDLERLLSLARAKRLRLVVLYGSFVAGDFRLSGPGVREGEESDLDIGFLPGPLPVCREDFYGLAAVRVDAKDLTPRPRSANSLYRFEVAETGVCVYEDPPGSWAEWRARAAADWERDRPLYEEDLDRLIAGAKSEEEISRMSQEECRAWLDRD